LYKETFPVRRITLLVISRPMNVVGFELSSFIQFALSWAVRPFSVQIADSPPLVKAAPGGVAAVVLKTTALAASAARVALPTPPKVRGPEKVAFVAVISKGPLLPLVVLKEMARGSMALVTVTPLTPDAVFSTKP